MAKLRTVNLVPVRVRLWVGLRKMFNLLAHLLVKGIEVFALSASLKNTRVGVYVFPQVLDVERNVVKT